MHVKIAVFRFDFNLKKKCFKRLDPDKPQFENNDSKKLYPLVIEFEAWHCGIWNTSNLQSSIDLFFRLKLKTNSNVSYVISKQKHTCDIKIQSSSVIKFLDLLITFLLLQFFTYMSLRSALLSCIVHKTISLTKSLF